MMNGDTEIASPTNEVQSPSKDRQQGDDTPTEMECGHQAPPIPPEATVHIMNGITESKKYVDSETALRFSAEKTNVKRGEVNCAVADVDDQTHKFTHTGSGDTGKTNDSVMEHSHAGEQEPSNVEAATSGTDFLEVTHDSEKRVLNTEAGNSQEKELSSEERQENDMDGCNETNDRETAMEVDEGDGQTANSVLGQTTEDSQATSDVFNKTADNNNTAIINGQTADTGGQTADGLDGQITDVDGQAVSIVDGQTPDVICGQIADVGCGQTAGVDGQTAGVVCSQTPDVVEDSNMEIQHDELASSEIIDDIGNCEVGEDEDDGGFRIEISDVRTVSMEEEEESDSSGSMAVVDLDQSKCLSQDTTFSEDDFSSPLSKAKLSKNNCIEGDRTPSENTVSSSSKIIPETAQSVTSIPLSHEGEESTQTNKKGYENVTENVQNSVEKEFEVDTGTDMLQALYNQTSSLRDPELSTMTTEENEVATVSPNKQTPASDLLSNLADTVKKIKSEPKDSGYEKALSASGTTGHHCITNLSLGERLRLPPGMCQSRPNEEVCSSQNVVQHINTVQKITPDLPPPSVLPFVSVVVTSSQSASSSTSVSSMAPTSVTIQNNKSMQTTTTSDSAVISTKGSDLQPKTVTVLVPFSSAADNTSKQMYVKIPSTKPPDIKKASATHVPVLASTAAASSPDVKQNVVLMKTVPESKDENAASGRNFEEDVLKMCLSHKVKSVDLTKVTEFLQRKNAMKSYKAGKPPDHFGICKKIHSCIECGDAFILKSSLEDHMKRCSMKITYFCSECDSSKDFYNKCQLLSHMRQHTDLPNPDKPPPPLKIHSDLISILTPSYENLEKFYPDSVFSVPEPKTDAGDSKIKCKICKTEFLNEDLLRMHFGYDDVICSFAYQCSNCQQIMPRQCALKAHVKTHQHSSPYVCPECGREFSSYRVFMGHLADDCFHYNRICLLKCEQCNIKLDGISRSKNHLLTHHVKRFMKCGFCNLAFDSEDGYELHVKTHHHQTPQRNTNVEYVSTCGKCKTLLHSKELLEKHMDVHIQEMKKNAQFGYKCLDCVIQKLVFPSKHLLFEHRQSHHNRFKGWHRCQTCGLKFKSAGDLKIHQEKVHPKPKKVTVPAPEPRKLVVFQCVKCNTSCPSAAELSKHTCKPGLKKTQLVVGMCTRCKMILPTIDFAKHSCSSIQPKPSNKLLQPKSIAPEPYPIHLLSVPLDNQKGSQSINKPASPAQSSKIESSRVSSNIPPASIISTKVPAVSQITPSVSVTFRCLYCKTNFASKEVLECHFLNCKIKHKTGAFKGRNTELNLSCNLCSVRFPTKHRLSLHVREHWKKGNFMCFRCNVVAFKSKPELKKHLLTCEEDVHKYTVKENCKVCNKDMYPFEKAKHLAYHSLTGMWICRHCQKNDFKDKAELNSHEIECGYENRPLEHGYCYTCHQTFSTLEQLVVHLQDHVKEGTLVCCKCQKSGFKTSQNLLLHHETCGSELMESMPGQMCSLCREAFPGKDINHLYRHLTQHVVKGVHICCKCQKMGWESHPEVKSHQIGCGMIEKHAKKGEKLIYKCKICTKGFSYWESLRHHLKMHRNRGSRICLRCHQIGWKSEAQLAVHIKECPFVDDLHLKKEAEQLSSDENSLSNISETKGKVRNRHMAIEEDHFELYDAQQLNETGHRGYKTMDHFCEHCGKKYSKFDLLQDHISKEHTSFPCHLCGLTYESKSALVSHVDVVHDGKRTFFSCDICKSKQLIKKFASQHGLQKHMQKAHKHSRRLSNTDVKDEDNAEDESSTSSNRVNKPPSLPPVKRLRVDGDSVYTCAKCSMVTDDAAQFAEHIKEHNTDKASQCPECGLCFTILPALKKHLFMVHKIRDSDKYLMDKGMRTEEEEFDSDSEELSPVNKKIKVMSDEEVISSGNPLECSICKRDYTNEKELRKHMRIHGMAFIRSSRRTNSRKPHNVSVQESPSRSDSSVSPATDKRKEGHRATHTHDLEEEDIDSFSITKLGEEAMETDQQNKDEKNSNAMDTFENVKIKQEVID